MRAMAGQPRLKVVIEKGPSAGAEVALAGQRVSIGRRQGADLMLTGDDFVSLDHAEIEWSEAGPVLRNKSTNGTLVNGKPVTQSPLAAGDKISIGLVHLLAVRPAAVATPASRPASVPRVEPPTRPAPAVAATVVTPAEKARADSKEAAGSFKLKLPVWLIAYLVLMAIAFAYFGFMKLRGSTAPGLSQIIVLEEQYAASNKLRTADTQRVLRLIQTAVVHERRGDMRSAYEAYREAISVRRPVDPRSPAYRFAISRIASIGPK